MRRLALREQVDGSAVAAVSPGAGQDRAVLRQDLAERVDDGERRDRTAARERPPGEAKPALRPGVRPEQLPDAAPGPRSDAAALDVPYGGAGRGPARFRVRPRGRIAEGEVEHDRRRHERDDSHPRAVADAALLEVADDAVGRGEAERAAARQHDRVRPWRAGRRPEQVGLTRPRPAAAHLARDDRALRGEDRGAARPPILIGPVPDQHPLGQEQAQRPFAPAGSGLWQTGQNHVPRPPSRVFAIVAPQRRHGSPSRP